MKILDKNIVLVLLSIVLTITSCADKFLDLEPKSEVTPDYYLYKESELAAYTISLYDMFPSHSQWSYGIYGNDSHTDNQINVTHADKYIPKQWRVAENGGAWNFDDIYDCNYFLSIVPDRHERGEIVGSNEMIDHYIGEMYMLRAYTFFEKVKALGDFPILTENLPLDEDSLIAASERKPHSEVVRFIIEDLDKAIDLMKAESPDGNRRNRLSKYCALLFKSRVALYEATWLKYFKGTAFVPNGSGWPGAEKDYNKDYQYQAGSIDAEINWLLDQSIAAAEEVAEAHELTPNTETLQQSEKEEPNPYFNMFGSVDMSLFSEVMLWRQYSEGLNICHNVEVGVSRANSGVGVSRGLVDNFLMGNGLPIYAQGSGYAGDSLIANVRQGRDTRLSLFLKDSGQINIWKDASLATHAYLVEPIPDITAGNVDNKCTSGYLLRKGGSFDGIQGRSGVGTVGAIVFRASEAYLNYMEAYYERHGSIGGKVDVYWNELRNRAGIIGDISTTTGAIDMTKESDSDWGSYSGGELIDDATLYCIRKERRSELIAEGMRDMDLRRWRAKDQMIETPYHMEGFKLHNSGISSWYQNESGDWNDDISWEGDGSGKTPTVSDPSISDYLRPYQVMRTNLAYGGYHWVMAHYWEPIANTHFRLTSSSGSGDYSDSPIYQNPGWPIQAGQSSTDW